jgi:hypothetical protein
MSLTDDALQRQFVLDHCRGVRLTRHRHSGSSINAAELCARMISQMDPAELGEPAST